MKKNTISYAISRRSFLADTSLAFASTAIAGTVLRGCSTVNSASDGTPDSGTTATIDLSAPENSSLTADGGAVYVDFPGEDLPLIVHRLSATEYVAFTSKCTHLGCEVELPAGGSVDCLCHGSKFDGRGNLVSGLAQQSLQSFPVTLEGNQITISTPE